MDWISMLAVLVCSTCNIRAMVPVGSEGFKCCFAIHAMFGCHGNVYLSMSPAQRVPCGVGARVALTLN